MTSLEQRMRQEDLHVGGTKADIPNKTKRKAKQKEKKGVWSDGLLPISLLSH